jgi:AcrR family transcriptional regulator
MTPEYSAPVSDAGILDHPRTPRSLRVHEAVLAATRDLLDEGGLPAVTVEAIASRSGVSTATIYKHWPCKTAVAAEAFGRTVAEATPVPETASALNDLTEQVMRMSALYAGPAGTVFTQLLAACAIEPRAGSYFREFFLNQRRAGLQRVWERAQAAGEVRPGIDADTATDVLFGPIAFRMLAGHLSLSEDHARAIIDAALGGLLTTPTTDHERG